MGAALLDGSAALSPRACFEAEAAEGRLVFQRDLSTGAPVFPPRLVAPRSGSLDLGWEVSSGLGTIYAVTAVHGPDGVRALALIDLDEGFRMLAAVVNVPAAEVRIGGRVQARMETGTGGAYPVFDLAEDAP